MIKFIRISNAFMIIVLMAVISAAFYQEFTGEGPPCPLCFLQRLGMIGVATGILMNLRFGVRIRHYAYSLLSALIGGAVAVRQICLHICPGFPIFGYPVFGYNLYTWSFIVFCCCTLAIVIFLFLFSPDQRQKFPMNSLEKFAFGYLVLITVANILLAFQVCELGPCPDPPWPPKSKNIITQ